MRAAGVGGLQDSAESVRGPVLHRVPARRQDSAEAAATMKLLGLTLVLALLSVTFMGKYLQMVEKGT